MYVCVYIYIYICVCVWDVCLYIIQVCGAGMLTRYGNCWYGTVWYGICRRILLCMCFCLYIGLYVGAYVWVQRTQELLADRSCYNAYATRKHKPALLSRGVAPSLKEANGGVSRWIWVSFC